MENDLANDYKSMRQEYAYDGGVMDEDLQRVKCVKWIIDNKLTAPDRAIIILYADCGSLRDLARRFGVSRQTMCNEVNRIKNIIKREYELL